MTRGRSHARSQLWREGQQLFLPQCLSRQETAARPGKCRIQIKLGGRSVTELLRNTAGAGPALSMHAGWCCMNGKNSSRCLDKKIQFGLHANPSQSVVQKSTRYQIKGRLRPRAYFGVNLVARPSLSSRGLTSLWKTFRLQHSKGGF